MITGHRVAVAGRAPAESHTLPWWTWAPEFLMRITARMMRNQPQHVRDGLQPDAEVSSTTEVY